MPVSAKQSGSWNSTAAMQVRVLFLSNLIKRRSFCPKFAILDEPKPPFLAPGLLWLSTMPNRPLRGERRRGGGDAGASEDDFFLRSLDFGDDKAEKAQQGAASPTRNRPLRGERRPERPRGEGRGVGDVDADDFFPMPKSGAGVRGGERRQTPLGRFRSGAMRGDWRDDSGLGKAKPMGGDDNFEEVIDKVFDEMPETGSKRNVKSNGSADFGERAAGGIGETLFQKLKLGDVAAGKKAEEAHQRPPTSTTGPASNSAAPEPESPPPEADEIFKKMKETGLIPNAVAMLDGLCKDGLVQEAMKLFGLMREKGTIPEVVIYTAVVEGFCKAAKFDDAKRIFRKMQKNGIVPNAFSFGVIIQGLCKGGKLDDSIEFCTEMFEAGHLPNAATFIGLVDQCCKQKGAEEAERLVKSFQDRNFAIDVKSIREHLDKKGPFSPDVWEAIFGKKTSKRPF